MQASSGSGARANSGPNAGVTFRWADITEAEAKRCGLGWGSCGCVPVKMGAVTHGIPFEKVADARFHHKDGDKLKRHQCGVCMKAKRPSDFVVRK